MFRVFVGHFDQSWLWRVHFWCFFRFWSENFANSFFAQAEIFGECGIELHGRHGAVHVCSGLPDALIFFAGCLSHDSMIWRLSALVISRNWSEIDSVLIRD